MSQHSMDGKHGLTRRSFARWVAFVGSTAWATQAERSWAKSGSLPPTPSTPDEKFWETVREQFFMPPELGAPDA
jgi:hypothetical protein